MSSGMLPLADFVARIPEKRESGERAYVAGGEPEFANCDFCGGVGWLLSPALFGDPDFGRVSRCRCVVEAEGVEARLRRYAQLEEVEGLNFDLPRVSTLAPDAVAAARQWTDTEIADRGWLGVSGPAGSGKTLLCGAVANALLGRSEPVAYARPATYLEDLRRSMNRDGAEDAYGRVGERLESAPTLILDGLDASSSLTDWGRERLRELIVSRWARSLPTMVSMSVGLESLDPHISSRLADEGGCRMVWLEGGVRRVSRSDPDLAAMAKRMRFDNFKVPERSRFNAANGPKRALEAAKEFRDQASWGNLHEAPTPS